MSTRGSAASARRVAVQANALTSNLRMSLAQDLGQSGFDTRDYYETFGWPPTGGESEWDADNYYALYLRNAYANAVVAQKPKTTWKHAPEVRDGADRGEPTDLERKVRQLDRSHDLWSYCHRIDRLAGIGRHGLLVLDLADTSSPEDFGQEFDAENTGANGLDLLNGFRVYPEQMIEDIDWGGPGSDRWGKPVSYDIDLGEDVDGTGDGDDDGTLTVHHSRVVNVPARVPDESETRARSRIEPVLNNILDLEKSLGSTAELSYRAADYGVNVNLDPEKVDSSGDAMEAMRDDLDRWYHGLQPFLRTTGADVETLGGEVKDPTGLVDNNVRAIATQTGIPQRVLEGASLGELASAEKDERQYFGLIAERQQEFAGPYIVRAVIDRLRDHTVLPDPAGEFYDLHWPDLTELSEQEMAEVHETRSKVLKNVQTVMPDLRGQEAAEYIETGEIPDTAPTANTVVDESDPDVQDEFKRINGGDG